MANSRRIELHGLRARLPLVISVNEVAGVLALSYSFAFLWEFIWYFGGTAPRVVSFPRFYRATYWLPVLIVCIVNMAALGALYSSESSVRIAALCVGATSLLLSALALLVAPQVIPKDTGRSSRGAFRDMRWTKRWGLLFMGFVVMLGAVVLTSLG